MFFFNLVYKYILDSVFWDSVDKGKNLIFNKETKAQSETQYGSGLAGKTKQIHKKTKQESVCPYATCYT